MRQKEGSGVERYVWESSHFPDDVASTLVFLREEVKDFVMKESVDRIPLYSVNLTILRTSPRRMLALLGETKSFDRITRPQKIASKRYLRSCGSCSDKPFWSKKDLVRTPPKQ